MSSSPFFSVICPAFNVEKYLAELLDSLYSQTFSDFEIILIDDCSKDNTLQIAEKYEDRGNLKIVRLKENTGNPFLARKAGIKEAGGRYIVVIDSDDFVEVDFLQKLYAKTKGGTDLVLSEMWKWNPQLINVDEIKGDTGEQEYVYLLPTLKIIEKDEYCGKELVKETLLRWQISMAGFAVKKEIFEEAYSKIPPEDYCGFFTDEFLSRWIILLSKTVRFSDARYYYRFNPESVTHRGTNTYISEIKRNEKVLKFCRENFGENSVEFEKALSQRYLHWISGLKLLVKDGIKGEERRRIIECVKEDRRDEKIRKTSQISFPYRMLLKLPLALSKELVKVLPGVTK